ncbi:MULTISPECIES: heavy-metal-associated domain-containing protein [unclassified Clostridium]|uniref:heavy-metal-associated domain-containing protein n=1 Tax=unclassified Clostridium TaxID=2614128 RepID=UPI0002981441|nr:MULTISPECIES: heavy-metal-associated domain-containing protein [unclassified Clostridium]EKQ55791.1 MAG: copper chaperone [Clostridium sp. Maddingley MBC34-26]
MKSYSLSFKQKNMLCHRCLMTVVKTLNSVEGLEEIHVDLESRKIKITYKDENISKDEIKDIVNRSILSGKVGKLKHSL